MNAILNQLPDQNKIAQNTSKRLRIGFATIGQSPRIDVVPAILEALGKPVDLVVMKYTGKWVNTHPERDVLFFNQVRCEAI